MKIFILTINLLLIAEIIIAQPVFTSANLPAIGVTINSYDLADTIQPSQITTGTNQYWNFSSVTSQGGLYSTTKYIDPINTPYYSSFPIATNATETIYPVDSSYGYVDFQSGYYDFLGAKYVSNGTIYTTTYNDPHRSFVFPFNYGDVFNDAYEYLRTNNTSSDHFHKIATSVVSAPGYGSLVLPSGTFINCLLLKRVTVSRDSSFTGSITTATDHTTTTYTFYNSTFAGSLFSLNYDSIYYLASGVSTSYYYGFYYNNVTSINEVNASDNISIYPNPTTNLFTINISGNYKKAEISISDLTGKIIYVSTISDSEKTEVNTKDFVGGVYLVQIQTADFIETKKLIVKN